MSEQTDVTIQSETAVVLEFNSYYRDDLTAVIGFTVRLGASHEDAKDIAQEAMLSTFSSWTHVDTPKAYTRQAAKGIFLRRLNNDKRGREAAERSWTFENAGSFSVSFDAEVEFVMQMLNTLPLEQREVMAWTIDGYKPTEIAEITSRQPGTVRSHLRHARTALKTQLAHQITTREEDRDG